MSFRGPPYPYHSCYDNFEWMKAYGDPNFDYHKTIAQIWALLILEMADRPVLPLNFEDYSRAVKSYVSDLESYADSMDAPWKSLEANTIFDLRSLNAAADEFVANAKEFHDWDRAWAAEVYGSGGFESNIVAIKRISHNTRMANFETNLLDVDGGVSVPPPLSAQPYRPRKLMLPSNTASWPGTVQTCHLCASSVVGLRRGLFPGDS